MAAVGGKVYFEISAHDLGVIEFDSNPESSSSSSTVAELGGIDVDMVELPSHMPMASTYLVESAGELFLVVVFFDGENFHEVAEVRVYRMDFSKPAWCEVDRIGDDHRIGISNFGASCSAYGGLKGNCVYFLNHLATAENFLHVFDLQDGTQQVQRPFRDMGFTLPPRPPFWLLPAESM
ncbi:hypothetical protein BRADI_2g36400v3 [Brachypodium distachyon]|uniref:KIB1-4 beta-propeller domain-containing protein n=1 Tax=Brachypodium distachyon TaxID=15368 RepID=A0A2K2DC43_BRADI|nr:hypothetical protein BRADI_2g36400v3 [Brachypodium distachyon]